MISRASFIQNMDINTGKNSDLTTVSEEGEKGLDAPTSNTAGKNARRAFTLIELLVSLAIISLLSSVVLASFSEVRESARDAQRVQDINTLISTIDQYFYDQGHPPGEDDSGGIHVTEDCDTDLKSDLVGLKYLNRLPTDPLAEIGCARDESQSNDTDYFYGWDSSRSGEYYCISVNRLETESARNSLRDRWGELADTNTGADAGIDDADFSYCFADQWGM